ncbi:MAG: hypothetical protein R2939_12615 [Kofleriaceae bacterium]
MASLPGGAPATTWAYDGVDWRQVVTGTAPPGRDGAATAFDRARQRLIVFGGSR